MPARTFTALPARAVAAPATRRPTPSVQPARAAGAPVGMPRFAANPAPATSTRASANASATPAQTKLASGAPVAAPSIARRTAATNPQGDARARFGQPNNRWETEAQRFALRVRESARATSTKDAPGTGGRTTPAHPGLSTSPPPSGDGVSSQAFPQAARVALESFTGADMSGLRVQRGPAAEATAALAGARAFTRFGQIHFSNAADDGDVSLLAHEAAHVLQQTWPTERLARLGLTPAPVDLLLRQPTGIPQIASRREAHEKLRDWFLPTPSSLTRTLNWIGDDTLPMHLMMEVTRALSPTLNPMRTLEATWGTAQRELREFESRSRTWTAIAARATQTDDPSLLVAARELTNSLPALVGSRWTDLQQMLERTVAVAGAGSRQWESLASLLPDAADMLSTLGSDMQIMLASLTSEPWVEASVRTALGCPANVKGAAAIGRWAEGQRAQAEGWVHGLGRRAGNLQSAQFDLSHFKKLAAQKSDAQALATELRTVVAVLEKPEGFVLERAKLAAGLPRVRQKIALLTRALLPPRESLHYAFNGLGYSLESWGNSPVLVLFPDEFDWMGRVGPNFETWISTQEPGLLEVAEAGLVGLDVWSAFVIESVTEADPLDEEVPMLPRGWWDFGRMFMWMFRSKKSIVDRLLEKVPLLRELIQNAADLWKRVQKHFEHFKDRIFKEGRILAPLWEFFLNVLGEGGLPTAFIKDIADRGASLIGKILKHPLRFLKNLAAAIKLGLHRFGENIGDHLIKGLLEWLFGEFDLKPPYTFGSIAYALLGSVGLSFKHVCERIAEYLNKRERKTTGPEVERKLRNAIELGEKYWKVGAAAYRWMKLLVGGKYAEAWEELKGHFVKLWQWLIDTAVEYVMKKLTKAIIGWVGKLLDPTGLMAAFTLIKTVYDAIRTLIQYAEKMLAMVREVFRAIKEIANDQYERAAEWVEAAASKILAVALAFFMRTIGMDSVVKAIKDGLEAVKTRIVFPAIDALIRLAGAIWEYFVAKAKEVAEWWKRRRDFTDQQGETRTLSYEEITTGTETEAVLHVSAARGKVATASTGLRTLADFLKTYVAANKKEQATLDEIKNLAAQIDHVKKETGGGFGKANGELIETLFNEIVLMLSELGGKGVKPPPTDVKYKPTSIYGEEHGREMLAEPLSTDPGGNIGSTPTSSDTVLWSKVKGYMNGGATYYIKGHLLNHHLHGPGVWKNLAPIAGTTNGEMERKAEGPVKRAVISENKVVRYKVNMVYGTHAKKPKTSAEEDLPSEIKAEATEMKLSKGNWVDSGAKIMSPMKLENEIR